jgi:aerobic-type carbon monoxide dehydrogenase small subunit (CoxS/CutS family)
MTDRRTVTLRVNGQEHQITTESRRTLAEVLREDLGLTGTHLGCEHGVCGACTVSLDGDAVRSCLVLAGQADGTEVVTIESLADDGVLGPLQTAMWDESSFQCAFCAPGFLMTLHCLIEKGERPTGHELREELSGNLCRCTGYTSILAGAEVAIRSAGGAEDDDA